MWYLIIPPIIVVISLSFVLWYLSRKGADPLIAKKASELVEEAQEQISFLRTKNFFLRVLEKTAYRFKVITLQIHNGMNDLTQILKARRRRFQEEMLIKKSLEQLKVSEPVLVAPRESRLQRFMERTESKAEDKPVRAAVGEEQEKEESILRRSSSVEAVLEKPIFRQSKPADTALKSHSIHSSLETVFPQPIPPLRPMVSETITHPETVRERTQADIFREEALIARIAVNPKDFMAYEELGDYYLEIGNIKDAKECYRQVLKLSPAHRIVRIKIRRLEKLLGQ